MMKNKTEDNNDAALEFIQHEDTDVPSCLHGPTFLFRRVTAAGKETLFYSCSAYRDRKKCSFYISKEDFERKKRRRQLNSSDDDVSRYADARTINYAASLESFKAAEKKKAADRNFCLECNVFILQQDLASHRNHKLKTPISDDLLLHPTRLLDLTVQNKAEAQYIFSSESANFILSALQREKVRCTVSIGCPSLFELLRHASSNSKKKAEKHDVCMLLDIDDRYCRFYEPSEFQRYNMFNHFFFDKEFDVENWMRTALAKTRSAPILLIDPPFGGLTDALCATLKKWRETWNGIVHQALESKQLPAGSTASAYALRIIWVFPYFQERRIRPHFRDLKMLDYRVTYANHPKFTTSKLSNKPSPIRVFTNISSQAFRFAEESSSSADSAGTEASFYRWCDKCESVAFRSNQHCTKCDRCTTKHGKTYRHCDVCARCVKPTRVHCDTCGRCVPGKKHSHQHASPAAEEPKKKRRKV